MYVCIMYVLPVTHGLIDKSALLCCIQPLADSDAMRCLQLAFVSGKTSGGAKALEAAAAAHAMLVVLGTDPAHGLLPVRDNAEHTAAEQQSSQHRTGSKGSGFLACML